MQDRFKFRIWDLEQKKFFSLADFRKFDVEFNFDPTTNEVVCEYDKKRYVVIQSTGLKDKNGKLIYEGDIVRESFGETGTYRVEYFPYSAEWQFANLDDEKPNWEMFSMQFEGMSENQGISTDLEIIGNIYENPELIGGAE